MLGLLVAAAAATTCPPISVAAQLPVRPHGVVLRGDVDGDRVPDVARTSDEPYLMALVAVSRRGLGILVARSHGASTTEATLFVVRRHRLVSFQWLELGGSVGTVVQQVDCV